MLDGAPVKVKTMIRLKELRITPYWPEDKFLPNVMNVELELIPFGLNQGGRNPKITLDISIPEYIRSNLEKALLIELEEFIKKENAK